MSDRKKNVRPIFFFFYGADLCLLKWCIQMPPVSPGTWTEKLQELFEITFILKERLPDGHAPFLSQNTQIGRFIFIFITCG